MQNLKKSFPTHFSREDMEKITHQMRKYTKNLYNTGLTRRQGDTGEEQGESSDPINMRY